MHSRRVVGGEADMVNCEIPGCDLAISAKAIHHVNPDDLPALFARIAGALSPGGCFILFDAMSMGPAPGEKVRMQSSRFRQLHFQRAIASGEATRAEIDARMDFKRKMKAAGKDVEYGHASEDLIRTMDRAGFDEVAVVWRMFSDTILLAFTPDAVRGG